MGSIPIMGAQVVKHMKLEDIGFYTLSDYRASQASGTSPMWRCEIILTDKCNFSCPYCRGLRSDCKGEMPFEKAKEVLGEWIKGGLKNVRFSGGEPTMYPRLAELVTYCKESGVEHIAVSTNGSANRSTYNRLLDAGVNDFSISLDACCASFASEMAGVDINFQRLTNNIRYLSQRAYVSVGVVLTEDNVGEVVKIVEFADSLSVRDIRIISAAQYDQLLDLAGQIPQAILDRHPILEYRVGNIAEGRNVRGITDGDSDRCYLVQDDSAVAGDFHFPCIIYMREHGEPIGHIGPNMRAERMKWMEEHDTHADPICRKNCLDVCIDYNNKCRELKK